MKDKQDAVRGSLIGGAAGDALGYTVEFVGEDYIFGTYGKQGITEYEWNARTNEAIISDDTQMTLFTAVGMLCAKNIGESAACIEQSYFDWLATQYYTYEEGKNLQVCNAWLRNIPALYSPRAPGNTCLAALKYRLTNGKKVQSYIADVINNSKGCGGVMRVAPIGLYYHDASCEEVAVLAAEAAAITHNHPLGYLPAAALAHIIHQILYRPSASLKEMTQKAMEALPVCFPQEPCVEVMNALMQKAIVLAENSDTDLNNIHQLGQGWVGEEALAIALYACLRYEHDFSKALIVSVNHKGDSDSTGAIAGNIIGALVGYEAIEEKWKQHLELKDVILEIADDIVRYDDDKTLDRSPKYS